MRTSAFATLLSLPLIATALPKSIRLTLPAPPSVEPPPTTEAVGSCNRFYHLDYDEVWLYGNDAWPSNNGTLDEMIALLGNEYCHSCNFDIIDSFNRVFEPSCDKKSDEYTWELRLKMQPHGSSTSECFQRALEAMGAPAGTKCGSYESIKEWSFDQEVTRRLRFTIDSLEVVDKD